MVSTLQLLIGKEPSKASVQDSALVIIDAQNEYAVGALTTKNISSTRVAIANLLEKYRKGKGLVIHIVHDAPAGAPIFTPGTELAEEFEELKPKEGEKVIRKKFLSSFTQTDLDAYLKEKGIKKIVLVGYMVS